MGAVAVGHGDHPNIDARCRSQREQSADAEHLVVRVRGDDDHGEDVLPLQAGNGPVGRHPVRFGCADIGFGIECVLYQGLSSSAMSCPRASRSRSA